MKKIIFALLFLLTSAAGAQQLKDVRHVVVASEKDKFHAWPANNGSWNWGDEILVGFTQGEFTPRRGHDIGGQQISMMSRSLDGGETWKMYDPDGFLDSDEIQFDGRGKRKLEKSLDFTHSGFAMRVFAEGYHGNRDPEGGFYYSYDRGKTWNGPYYLGDVANSEELKDKALSPRTDYIVQDKDTCLVFISARPKEQGGRNRMACIKTEDGGKSFDFVSWVTPASDTENAIMSQTIQLSKNTLLLTYRKIIRNAPDAIEKKPNTIDAYLSKDNGATWNYLSTVVEIGGGQSNPPALIKMKDGRLCCIYGDRHKVKMLGRYSKDNGKTWGEEFVIRDNFSGSDSDTDFGYPRLVQREDGRLVAMYYWATKDIPQQYIAASIWTP